MIFFTGAKDFVGSSDKSTQSISETAPNQRHGSVSSESNISGRSGINGKRRNPKKILRRRSSSGAEILSPIVSESMKTPTSNNAEISTWNRYPSIVATPRRTESDSLLAKRRGSLPTDVLSVGLGKL